MTPTLRPRLLNGRFGDPALFVELAHEREAVLFDAGDCSALGGRDTLRIKHLFVSHMHMDHFVGFDALVRAHVGGEAQLVVVGPDGIGEAVGHRLAAYTWDLAARYALDFVVEVRELRGPERLCNSRFRLKTGFARETLAETEAPGGVVAATQTFSVSAARLEHHGPCLAFAMAEPLHVNVWRNKVEARGLPVGPWLKPLKAAMRDGAPSETPIALPDGETAPLETLRDLVSVERGQKLGYVTDIRDTAANREAVVQLCREADLLFIEAAFAAADRERAFDRAHLTTDAAGAIARQAGVRAVEPFHFSPRYAGEEARLRAEVDAAFRG